MAKHWLSYWDIDRVCDSSENGDSRQSISSSVDRIDQRSDLQDCRFHRQEPGFQLSGSELLDSTHEDDSEIQEQQTHFLLSTNSEDSGLAQSGNSEERSGRESPSEQSILINSSLSQTEQGLLHHNPQFTGRIMEEPKEAAIREKIKELFIDIGDPEEKRTCCKAFAYYTDCEHVVICTNHRTIFTICKGLKTTANCCNTWLHFISIVSWLAFMRVPHVSDLLSVSHEGLSSPFLSNLFYQLGTGVAVFSIFRLMSLVLVCVWGWCRGELEKRHSNKYGVKKFIVAIFYDSVGLFIVSLVREILGFNHSLAEQGQYELTIDIILACLATLPIFQAVYECNCCCLHRNRLLFMIHLRIYMMCLCRLFMRLVCGLFVLVPLGFTAAFFMGIFAPGNPFTSKIVETIARMAN